MRMPRPRRNAEAPVTDAGTEAAVAEIVAAVEAIAEAELVAAVEAIAEADGDGASSRPSSSRSP